MLAPGIVIKRRILFLLTAFALFASVLSGRLVWLQVGRSEWLAGRGEGARLRRIPLQAPRGDIVDRGGRLLAGSTHLESVYVQPALVQDRQRTAHLLAQALAISEERVRARVGRPSYFEWIARKVSPEAAARVRTLALPGVGLVPEAQRYYPGGSLAAHALGIAGLDKGLEGLELVYDQYLKGGDGALMLEYDARGLPAAGGGKHFLPPEPGLTLVTTLDADIQHIVEQQVERTIQETKARSVAILVMETRTGGILGMAMRPTFEPGDYAAGPAAQRRLWVVADSLEPGSIFKPVTASAALDLGLVDENTVFPDPGCITVQGWGRPICNYDRTGLGSATVAQIMERSSNVGFLQIGQRVGIPNFYEYLHRFGLDRPTGIDLPGEASGQRPPQKAATLVDLSVMAFGQTITITPLQMLSAIATIGNDGKRMRPHLMQELRSPSGAVVRRWEPQVLAQVMKPETARTVQRLMEQVVARGTGRNAQVQNYLVAGKTGTAEKIEGGVRAAGKYTASFVGIGPVPDPRIAVLITIDEPQGVYYGGQIAAPVFGRMAGDIFDVLQVPPAAPVLELATVPALVNLPLAMAREAAIAAGVELFVEGDGLAVAAQAPPAGTALPRGSRVWVRAGTPPAGLPVTVPDLRRLDLPAAAHLLAQVGLALEPEGEGTCVAQEPPPGVQVAAGSPVRVRFSAPESKGTEIEGYSVYSMANIPGELPVRRVGSHGVGGTGRPGHSRLGRPAHPPDRRGLRLTPGAARRPVRGDPRPGGRRSPLHRPGGGAGRRRRGL